MPSDSPRPRLVLAQGTLCCEYLGGLADVPVLARRVQILWENVPGVVPTCHDVLTGVTVPKTGFGGPLPFGGNSDQGKATLPGCDEHGGVHATDPAPGGACCGGSGPERLPAPRGEVQFTAADFRVRVAHRNQNKLGHGDGPGGAVEEHTARQLALRVLPEQGAHGGVGGVEQDGDGWSLGQDV